MTNCVIQRMCDSVRMYGNCPKTAVQREKRVNLFYLQFWNLNVYSFIG